MRDSISIAELVGIQSVVDGRDTVKIQQYSENDNCATYYT